jgi:hypothetical protein
VLKENGAMSAGDVKRLFEGRLADYKHPRDVIFTECNVMGKVDADRLPMRSVVSPDPASPALGDFG